MSLPWHLGCLVAGQTSRLRSTPVHGRRARGEVLRCHAAEGPEKYPPAVPALDGGFKHGYGSKPIIIIILMGWTSIYQLFWGSPGVQGFDTLPHDFCPINHEWKPNARPCFEYLKVGNLKVGVAQTSGIHLYWFTAIYIGNLNEGHEVSTNKPIMVMHEETCN